MKVPTFAGRPLGARTRRREAFGQRMHPFRAEGRLQEADAMDAEQPPRRPTHLSARRIQACERGKAFPLREAPRSAKLGFGALSGGTKLFFLGWRQYCSVNASQ